MRWLMVIATLVVLVANGFNPMNARLGDWLILGGLTYGVFLVLLLLELLFRTISKVMLIPFLVLIVTYPLAIAPWAYTELQTIWPEGQYVEQTNPTDFPLTVQYEGLSTYAYIRNTTDGLIEHATVACDIHNAQGAVIETVHMQMGQGWAKPGEVIRGRVLGGAQYAVRDGAVPQATTCVVSKIALVQK